MPHRPIAPGRPDEDRASAANQCKLCQPFEEGLAALASSMSACGPLRTSAAGGTSAR